MKIQTLGASAFRRLITIAFLLGIMTCPASSADAPKIAPDFSLKDVVGEQTYTLSQFKGKVVLINYITFICGPCREEMPYLNQIDKEFKSQGFQTLGIGLASPAPQLRELAKQLGLEYPLLLGNDQVSKAYGGVEFVPITFIVDRQGKIAHKIVGARSKADFIKMIRPLL